jgi:cytochrome c biogenesis protein CcmG/thiol:disulfide interchange protein DsbE
MMRRVAALIRETIRFPSPRKPSTAAEAPLIRRLFLSSLVIILALPLHGADLVRLVRYKLSAGDLVSGIAAVDDYKQSTGVDAEYLDAVGWLARGAEMLHRPDLAHEYVSELRKQIPAETPELLVPLGAAIEVEGRLLAAEQGRGSAIRFWDGELAKTSAPALRSRISKDINLLSLEGSPAPAITGASHLGNTPPTLASLRGKPVLLYFWLAGCGDCKAQSPSLSRVWQKYRSQGLGMITVTRMYGTIGDKAATPEEEMVHTESIWKELYSGLEGVSAVIDTDTMVRYGASATPTFALVDRKGIVRLYSPTRLSEGELSRRIEELLGEE